MKKFTKLFLSCAAVAAVTAAVASSAMAADLTAVERVEGTEVDTVNITIPAEYTDTTKTLVILKPTADKTAIKAEDIIAIDQDASIVSATIAHLDAEADAGTYLVLMGGTEGNIYEGSFVVGTAPVEGVDILIGDTNLNGELATNDATFLLRKVAGSSTGTQKAGDEYTAVEAIDPIAVGGKIIVGDTNLNGELATNDVTFLLRKVAGSSTGTQKAGLTAKAAPVAE